MFWFLPKNYEKMIKREYLIAIILFALATILAFWPFFINGKVPIAGDAILGTYYPWLDQKWGGYQTIFPVLNPTISDSVTSFYPWKYKAISEIKNGTVPLIDNSSFMGNPLFATGTTGILYPLNIVFLLLPFNQAWGLLVSLTPFLSAIFLYLWLRSKSLHPAAAIIAGISYAFSAFIGLQVTFVNSPHAVLWLPLVLLCVDRILEQVKIGYFVLMIFAVFASLNAGFFQGSLYLLLFSFLYFVYQSVTTKSNYKGIIFLSIGFILPILLSAVQIIPFIELVIQSSRIVGYGGAATNSEVFQFFVQFKYLVTTFVPDFFGNPGKWNYWGNPNYYEFNNFVGSINIIGLFSVIVSRKNLKILSFFLAMLVVSIVLAIPNFISQFPYYHSWPIISSLVPARILLITQFCIIVLSAYGLSSIFERKLSFRQIFLAIIMGVSVNLSLLFVAFAGKWGLLGQLDVLKNSWDIAFKNSILPFLIITATGCLIFLFYKTKKHFFIYVLVLLAALELIRQTGYFRPFIQPELLYPKTEVTTFLQNNSQSFRYMITHHDLLPSNLQTIYGLETVDGAGPLFPENYNRMTGGINFAKSLETLPHFARTINFTNYSSPAINLLNIKYVLSLEELKSSSLKLVLQSGKINLYENSEVLPRVWIAKKPLNISSPVEVLKTMNSLPFSPRDEVIVSDTFPANLSFTSEEKEVMEFSGNSQLISIKTRGDGILVFSEQYYPGWKGFVDNKETNVFPVDSDLIGLVLPPGEHRVKLLYSPESFKIGLRISLMSLVILVVIVAGLKFFGFKR